MYSLLYLVPKNWLSRSVGWAVRRRWPFGLHRSIRDSFIRHFNVDISESEHAVETYPTLGEFFIRRLRPETRPIGKTDLVSPVDGMLTQRGFFETVAANPLLTQIKGIQYSLQDFTGEGWDISGYGGGAFLTVYLAPWNYHRIHSPVNGRVLRARHLAGALWPVNQWSVEKIPDLFVRNDRILVEMECDLGNGKGRVLVAMVGATNVGRITLSFPCGLMGNSLSAGGIRDWQPSEELILNKGSELGCFEMGSTVVLVVDALLASKLKRDLRGTEPVPLRYGADLLS